MDVQKLYEILTGEPHPDTDGRRAPDGAARSVREALPGGEWSFGKRLLGFAAYVAVLVLLVLLVAPRP